MKRYIALIVLIIFSFQFSGCQINDKINEENMAQEEIVQVNKDETTQEESVNIYKQDYLEACTLISENYIYLDRKLNKSRADFLQECKEYAETVDWNKGETQFIEEIRTLRSKFNDGHFYWQLDKELWLNERGKFLGIILTIGNDDKVYVGKVYEYFTDKLSVGDEIIKWNGEDIKTEIERIGKLNPQSTAYATNELAARRLTFEIPWQPLRKELEPVTITCKDKNGIISDINVEWKDCGGTSQWENNDNQSNTVLLTHSYKPSLADIPPDTEYVHPSLLFYSRIENSKKYTILHPTDFYDWNTDDLEKTFERILNEEPDILVIDLKDSAGGAFQQVLYLSYILNVQKQFEFYHDIIESDTGMRLTGISNFNFITDEIDFQNVWRGKVIFRINPLTASGGDFFARWMQLSQRGLIIGQPSAGAGGGTDSFLLKNTKTEISFPLRERIILGDDKSIERNSVIPDYLYDGELIDFLIKYDTLNIKTKANNE